MRIARMLRDILRLIGGWALADDVVSAQRVRRRERRPPPVVRYGTRRATARLPLQKLPPALPLSGMDACAELPPATA